MSHAELAVTRLVRARALRSLDGAAVPLPHPQRLVHLQLRRFAGCPFCSMHLRSIEARHAELQAAGVQEVVVFRSTEEELRAHHRTLPFPVIADPHEALYAEFGVPSGWRSVLDARAWPRGLRGLLRQWPRLPKWPPRGQGALGLPGDFLIAPGGEVLAAHIGEHAYDQWSVDEVLQKAADASRPR